MRIPRAAMQLLCVVLPIGAATRAVSLQGTAAQKPQVYTNEEFGIKLPIPKGAVLCATPETEHDHGPLLILDPAIAKGCNTKDGGRFIDVFAFFNALEDTARLHDFLKWACKIASSKDRCQPPPSNLGIDGMQTSAARVNHSDGWIRIIVVTQGGKPDLQYAPTVPSVNYDLSLHTKAEYLEEDLRIFRIVLRTIRLNPGESSDPEKRR